LEDFMLRKNYFTVLLTAALFLVGSAAIFAQTAPVRGKSNWSKRTARESRSQARLSTYSHRRKRQISVGKTNKKGEFSFAGLQLGQTFALSISASNIKPALQPGIKAGMENIVITVSEGDGKRWSEEEVVRRWWLRQRRARPQQRQQEPPKQATKNLPS
jgi:hypothetical protein